MRDPSSGVGQSDRHTAYGWSAVWVAATAAGAGATLPAYDAHISDVLTPGA